MKLGIDFGTTRVVVAAADRGNYPVISFETPEGTTADWYPPLIALSGGERLYGWQAFAVSGREGWTLVRSVKRLLEDAGPSTQLAVGGHTIPLADVLAEMMCDLRAMLRSHSTLGAKADEPFETMLGVPANANSNQRFLTAEAFRCAGFDVLGLLNEPSAASIEFAHRNQAGKGQKDSILVYDLGGGTFDVSLVEMGDREHDVIATEGIATLGGDDFDHILAELALAQAGIPERERQAMNEAELFRLHEECRQKKEALNPNSRRVVIDLSLVREDWDPVSFPVNEFYERARPLIDETLHATMDLAAAHDAVGQAALYVTGGGSELPLVARVLREQFGRQVRRSTYTRAATAIGLAIQADAQAGYTLREKFSRHFGVWRETDCGRGVMFDALFDKGTPLPLPGAKPLVIAREYSPAHNIGHFRYLECSHRTAEGRPSGSIAMWDEIRFPFEPQLAGTRDLAAAAVLHSELAATERIEESYACDASGAVTVTIANLTSGYTREYRLGRWAEKPASVSPKRRSSRKATKA